MRLATFTLKAGAPGPRLGALLGEQMVDLAECARASETHGALPASMKGLLALGKPGLDQVRHLLDFAAARGGRLPAGVMHEAAAIRYLPPIPDAEKFLCVGKNYRTHLEELKRNDLIKEMPGEPTGFIKLNSCLTGHESEVARPATVVRLDYEPELVFVIGKRAFGAGRKDALDYVAGIPETCSRPARREASPSASPTRRSSISSPVT